MRIGVLGGTFDPIHIAHLATGEQVRARLELEEVVFVPAGEPWMKAGAPLSPARHRLDMTRLAVAGNPFFRASSVEVDRSGPSYTVDTLEALAGEYGPGVELFFIMGADALADFQRWKSPRRILELAKLAVVSRPGFNPEISPLSAAPGGVVMVETDDLAISATEIRRRVAAGESVRYLVPDRVYRHILDNGLYTP